MPSYPKYYVRPDGLHESILTINGKRKAFRGKTDKEVYEKIKNYKADTEEKKTVPFSEVAHACLFCISRISTFNK